jgi:hypothetical protein
MAGRSTRSLDLGMRRLLEYSPVRGFRWLFTFAGVLFVSLCTIAIFEMSQEVTGKDIVALAFPTPFFVVGAASFYIGVFAEDSRVSRVVNFLRGWW